MKKNFFYSFFALVAVLLFVQIPSAEARHCRGSRTNIQINAGTYYNRPQPYVVQRVQVLPQPVYIQPVQYYNVPQPVQYYNVPQPGYYVYPATTVVEQVYVAPAPRPSLLSGLSFSWNFFN